MNKKKMVCDKFYFIFIFLKLLDWRFFGTLTRSNTFSSANFVHGFCFIVTKKYICSTQQPNEIESDPNVVQTNRNIDGVVQIVPVEKALLAYNLHQHNLSVQDL